MTSARGIRAGRAYVEVGADLSRLERGLDAARKRLGAWGASLVNMGARLTAVGGAASAGFLPALRHFSRFGDALDKASIRTGVSVERLSELGYAASQSGSNLQAVERGLRNLSRLLGEAASGSDSAASALQSVGLSAENLLTLSPDQQLRLIAESLAAIEDPSLRSAAAMKLFGRSGTELLPLLSNGAAGIDELTSRARAFGLTVSTDTAKRAAVLSDALGTLRAVIGATAMQIGDALAPSLTRITNAVSKNLVAFRKWIEVNKGLVVAVAATAVGVAALGAAMIAAGLAAKVGALMFAAAGAVIATVKIVLAALSGVLTASALPWLALAAAVAAGVAILAVWLVQSGRAAKGIEYLGRVASWLGETWGRALTGISDALQAGRLDLALEVVGAALQVTWAKVLSELNKQTEDAVAKIRASLLIIEGFANVGKSVLSSIVRIKETPGQWIRQQGANIAAGRGIAPPAEIGNAFRQALIREGTRFFFKLGEGAVKTIEKRTALEEKLSAAHRKYADALDRAKKAKEEEAGVEYPTLPDFADPGYDFEPLEIAAQRSRDFVRSSFGAGNAAEIFGGAGGGTAPVERRLDTLIGEARSQKQIARETLEALRQLSSIGNGVFA